MGRAAGVSGRKAARVRPGRGMSMAPVRCMRQTSRPRLGAGALWPANLGSRQTMTHLFLIRHGRPASIWGGEDSDPGLDDEGARQATAAAQTLMNLPPAERPTKVVSSPLRRCLETARPFAEALNAEMEVIEAVGEIPTPRAFGPATRGEWLRRSLQGSWSEIVGDLDYDLWRRSVFDAVRVRPGAAIFSHFVAINAVLSLIEGQDQVITFRPDHTSITVLDATDDDLRIVDRGREAATSVL